MLTKMPKDAAASTLCGCILTASSQKRLSKVEKGLRTQSHSDLLQKSSPGTVRANLIANSWYGHWCCFNPSVQASATVKLFFEGLVWWNKPPQRIVWLWLFSFVLSFRRKVYKIAGSPDITRLQEMVLGCRRKGWARYCTAGSYSERTSTDWNVII